MLTQAGFTFSSRVGTKELNAWERSLPVLLTDLVDAGLGEVEVLLEHQLPHSTRRVDAVLCGVHPRSGRTSYVVVELKQWSSVSVDLHMTALFTVPGLPGRQHHPVMQVRDYCQYLVDHTPALADRPQDVRGVVYMHNARRADLMELADYEPTEFGLMFTMEDKAAMVAHLSAALDPSAPRQANLAAGDEFLGFAHQPSQPLLDVAAKRWVNARSSCCSTTRRSPI
jgi:hypothetical protein